MPSAISAILVSITISTLDRVDMPFISVYKRVYRNLPKVSIWMHTHVQLKFDGPDVHSEKTCRAAGRNPQAHRQGRGRVAYECRSRVDHLQHGGGKGGRAAAHALCAFP